MRFNRYMGYLRDTPATHPQTGETLPYTTVDLYIYDNRIDVMGFGTQDTVQPEGGVTPERIAEVRDVMRAQGYRLTCDIQSLAALAPAKQAVMAR